MIALEHVPFDLERAKAGDVVECYMPNEENSTWETAVQFVFFNDNSGRFAAKFKGGWFIEGFIDSDKDLLRMKYPPETGVKND